LTYDLATDLNIAKNYINVFLGNVFVFFDGISEEADNQLEVIDVVSLSLQLLILEA